MASTTDVTDTTNQTKFLNPTNSNETTPKKETIQLEFSYEEESAEGKVTRMRKLEISPARHRQFQAIMTTTNSRDGHSRDVVGQTQTGFDDNENDEDSRQSLGRMPLPGSTDNKKFLAGDSNSMHSLPGGGNNSRHSLPGQGGDSNQGGGEDSRQSLPDSDVRRPEQSSKRKATPTKNQNDQEQHKMVQAKLKKRKSEKKDSETLSTPPPKSHPESTLPLSSPPMHAPAPLLDEAPAILPSPLADASTNISPPPAVAALAIHSSPPANTTLQASSSSPSPPETLEDGSPARTKNIYSYFAKQGNQGAGSSGRQDRKKSGGGPRRSTSPGPKPGRADTNGSSHASSSPSSSPLAEKSGGVGGGVSGGGKREREKHVEVQEQDLAKRLQEVTERERRVEQKERELAGSRDDEQQQMETMRAELEQYQEKVQKMMVEVLREYALMERKIGDEQVLRERHHIGRVVPVQEGHMVTEMWEEGEQFQELKRKERKLIKEKEEIESEKKILSNKKRSSTVSKKKESEATPAEEMDDDGFKKPKSLVVGTPDADALLAEQDEIIKFRIAHNKKELADIKTEQAELEVKKEAVIRSQKLKMDQQRSRFNNRPVLHDRYLILNILGKGGFSEVYKAFDLQEFRYVACKIHQLNTSWSDERKRNYTRHATREYNIHKQLKDSRVVQLFDVFAIDLNAFCTVLEFCDGTDLDMYLKACTTMPEKDARCVMMQVFTGIKYLEKNRIIHYDLKPANILFHKGEVKLTDFGLSKILPSEQEASSMELTSQGAGTYWYLPPECFGTDAPGMQPKITSKVDIWSCGVILFQLIYGVKPFGQGLSPDALLSQRTISNAKRVEFPSKPIVSQVTKDFIQRCLTHRVTDRPDIHLLFDDAYFRKGKK